MEPKQFEIEPVTFMNNRESNELIQTFVDQFYEDVDNGVAMETALESLFYRYFSIGFNTSKEQCYEAVGTDLATKGLREYTERAIPCLIRERNIVILDQAMYRGERYAALDR